MRRCSGPLLASSRMFSKCTYVLIVLYAYVYSYTGYVYSCLIVYSFVKVLLKNTSGNTKMVEKEALTHQVESLHLDDTKIDVDRRQLDIVRGLLAGEERHNVVVFGEGNFTFSMALASHRQS